MTTAAASGGNHVNIVIQAVDRVTKTVQSIRRQLGQQLKTSITSAAFSFLSLGSIIGALGFGVTNLITRFQGFVADVRKTNQAAARLSLTLRAAGFSADRTNTAILQLRNSLSRTALQALSGLSRELQVLFSRLQPETQTRISDLAERMAELTGIPMEQWLAAMLEGLQGNLEPLKQLGVNATETSDALDKTRERMQELEGEQSNFEVFVDRVSERLGFFGSQFTTFAELMSGVFNRITDGMAIALGKIEEFFTNNSFNLVERLFGNIDFSQLAVNIALGLADAWDVIKAVWEFFGNLFGQTLWGSFMAFMTETLPGWFVDTVTQTIPQFFTKTLPEWAAAGKDMAREFVRGFIDGMRQFLQSAANWAIAQINKIIAKINAGLARIGVRRRIPSLGGVTIDSGPDLGPREFEGGRGGGGGASLRGGGDIVIPVSIGDRPITTIVVDAMNRAIRTREPGLGTA